jgi:hypothetical protein
MKKMKGENGRVVGGVVARRRRAYIPETND